MLQHDPDGGILFQFLFYLQDPDSVVRTLPFLLNIGYMLPDNGPNMFLFQSKQREIIHIEKEKNKGPIPLLSTYFLHILLPCLQL